MNDPVLQEASPLHTDTAAPDGRACLRVQLWSYNYDPEPTGIGPVSKVLAEGLRSRGHAVEVVAAHPHYPDPLWGARRMPYREIRNGIPVLRLPLWVGRARAMERYRQELSYMLSQFAALPTLRRPDVLVCASPCFPALLPAIAYTRLRTLPWLLWLQDILPDGAAATGLLGAGLAMDAARRLERAAYREADRIVVPSQAFSKNLESKGVPPAKLTLLHNPPTRVPTATSGSLNGDAPHGLRILSMGNIGYSQGVGPIVEAFECSPALQGHDVKLVITGDGVAAEEVRRRITSNRVEMLGLVDDGRLETELHRADVALVTQHHEGAEFNFPSKLMNFMSYGLPVLAAVNPDGEVARIIRAADAGWIIDSSEPAGLPEQIARLMDRPGEIAVRGAAAAAYSRQHFTQAKFVARFEAALGETVARGGQGAPSRKPLHFEWTAERSGTA
jgi:colanic acid biosynthesis glycosyl transferase WcaI